MKIGILTQPLYCNYGGIVQCYALQTVLQRMGQNTVILQREFNRRYSIKGACIYYAKHFIKLLMRRRSSWHYYVSQKRRDYIAQNTYHFIEKHINPRSQHCYSLEELRTEVDNLNLDAIIVGSDQVWRPDYSPCQPNYFLDFLGKDERIKRISYAASFGSDDWTFDDDLTALCGDLLRQFKAVSVREQSAIKLCREHFNVDAVQTLDPTMLLEAFDYRKLYDVNRKKRGSLFCYVLDRSLEKKNVIAKIVQNTKLQPFESMPELSDETYNLYKDIVRCVYPPVENWLSAFDDAEMIVTDSFHGTVFSIIYNKPFWVIANEGRGMARFQSLLSVYGLEERLLTTSSLSSVDFGKEIDWNKVNLKRKHLQQVSLDFLLTALQ